VPDESLITDEVQAFIGKESEPIEVTLDRAAVERMRQAVADDDPRFADPEFVPAYAMAAIEPIFPMGAMPRVLPSGLLTQNEWRIYGTLRFGQKLQAVNKVVDIRERMGGRYGHSVIVILGTDYRDEDGNVVASSLRTMTQFDPKGAER
jgi:hypothetical protein